jgi:hypothetical protein
MSSLRGEVGRVKGTGGEMVPVKVGLELSPTAGTAVTEFECTALLKIVLRGAAIGVVLPKNTMYAEFVVTFEEEPNGKQLPEKFETGPPVFLEASFDGGPFERSGLNFEMMLTTEERIEANAVV